MRSSPLVLCLAALVLAPGVPARAAEPAPQVPDRVLYPPRYEDPVLKEMEEQNEARDTAEQGETARIRGEQSKKRAAERAARKQLRFDVGKVVRPAGPAAFKQAFHFAPVAQYLTNTCWSFSTTSFYESEIARLTGEKIRLSEMYTVYWEYVEKMRRFVRERGDSAIAEGSEGNALARIWSTYGIVPLEAYAGRPKDGERHDHARLIERIRELSRWVRQHEMWDEATVLRMTRALLDAEIGAPPERVTWGGATYTPQEFLSKVTKLDPANYVEVMSTLSAPFWTFAEYRFPDNWWHDANYYNVPLADWYGAMRRAVQGGYTVAIGGDVSEPGLNGFESIAVIPSFDIPYAAIDQDAREFRIDNRTTDDDHGVHIVGFAQAGGHDWFLVKDSARSSRWGKYPGYYFYRDDYVKLKMLTYTVHKDAVKDLLAKKQG